MLLNSFPFRIALQTEVLSCTKTMKAVDEGFYIQNTATTAFMVLVQDMTSVCRAIRKGKEFKSMSYGSFNVTNLKDLAKSKLGRKRKVA